MCGQVLGRLLERRVVDLARVLDRGEHGGPSREINGPQVSAPDRHGEELLAPGRAVRPRAGTANMPSLEPSWLPSVEIHRLPPGSKAMLSGQEIGLTWSLG